MKVLFDQGTPVPLRQSLPLHEVATAFEKGWAALSNGELLQVAEDSGFDVLVTTDQNRKYQQNLSNRVIALVVLTSTSWPRIQLVLDSIVSAVEHSKANAYIEVEIPLTMPGRF